MAARTIAAFFICLASAIQLAGYVNGRHET
jgi:hypothetical protein